MFKMNLQQTFECTQLELRSRQESYLFHITIKKERQVINPINDVFSILLCLVLRKLQRRIYQAIIVEFLFRSGIFHLQLNITLTS